MRKTIWQLSLKVISLSNALLVIFLFKMGNQIVDFIVVVTLLIWSIIYSIIVKITPAKLWHKNVQDKIVLVTGGGSGFGRILARKFAVDHKSIVVIWDINQQG